jgi:phospholipid/cholesterol/gamma-HCH transport system substrate-binding protein
MSSGLTMTKNTKIGMVIILTLILFCFGFVGYGILKQHFNSYVLTLVFQKADGVNVGDEVRYLGVEVGQVKKIITVDKKVLVDIVIDKQAKVPINSIFHVQKSGLLSGKSVSIIPSVESNYYRSKDTIFNTSVDSIPSLEIISNTASAAAGVGTMVMQSKIISKLDTILKLLKEEKSK